MRGFFVAIGCTIVSTVSLASDCPDGDRLLQNNTPLSQLCPNGFTSNVGGQIESQINQNGDNAKMVMASAGQNGVPTDLALAVSTWESGLKSCAGSYTGVKGPMQLTQATGKGLGYDRDINEQNIQGGMKVLKAAYDKCGYNTTCLASRYNGSNVAGEQAGWARGVQGKLNQLQKNPDLIAQACTGASCMVGAGDLPTSTATQIASSTPAPAQSDITVGSNQV